MALSPQEEAAWATAMMLALLEKKFGSQKKEWKLLAKKAKAFITACGEEVEELLAKARLALVASEQQEHGQELQQDETEAEPSE